MIPENYKYKLPDYLNNKLSPNEKQLLEQALEQQEDLKTELATQKQLKEAVEGKKKTAFKPFFKNRLINKINNLGNKKDVNDYIFLTCRRYAWIGAAVIIILLTINITLSETWGYRKALGISNTLDNILSYEIVNNWN